MNKRPFSASTRNRLAVATLRTVLSAALLAGCTSPARNDALPALPETGSGFMAKPGWTAQRFAVAAANPLAAQAGFQVLKAGGTAADAAVSVQMVLALVEPQSSGLGGGAFLLHWDGRQVQAWDGRETAPAAADEKLFLQADGKPIPMPQAGVGGRSVGVPGAVRMLEDVHRAHGRLPWAQLLQPAIALAERGFAISPRLHTLLKADAALKRDPPSAAFYYGADGQPHPVGHVLRNPALAAVLKSLAAQGSAALHGGAVAADVVARVQTHPSNPGRLALVDLQAYRSLQREPICTDWLARWRVCGMPPPSSGHLAVMQILGLLERQTAMPSTTPPLQGGLLTPDWLHAYTEASRLAFADRAQYLADPDFVPPPAGRWTRLLDDAYLRQRAALIGPRSMGRAEAGSPSGQSLAFAPQADQLEHGTSHFSIVDGQGRAVAMTTSVGDAFGARLMSNGGTGLPGGFLLNNQLTDFSAEPVDAQGRPVANRVQPGKRPRSSMSPTLVFERSSGRLVMILGSALGPAIIHATAKSLFATLDWGLDAQRAIDLPNFGSYNGPTVLEKGRFSPATVDALKARGHTVVESELTTGVQALQRTSSGWLGGADPRREGVVMGE